MMSLLRKKILASRDDQLLSSQQNLSCEIQERLLSLDKVIQSQVVFIYINFRSEVQTVTLVQLLLQQGKQVVVPATIFAEKKLLAVVIHDLSELTPGYCSILEPRCEIRDSRLISGSEIDLTLLPGSVFDTRGGRMGYGGGFYDRFLANEAPSAYRIGLAYDLQVVDNLVLQPHDELMDLIVTEKRIIHGERTGKGGRICDTENSYF